MPSIALGDNGGRNVTSHFGNQRTTNEHDQSDPKCGNSTSKSSFRSSGCGRDGFVRQALGGQSPNNATRGASTIVDDDQRVSGDDPSSEAPRVRPISNPVFPANVRPLVLYSYRITREPRD